MNDVNAKTEMLADVMLAAHQLWSWRVNPDLTLFSTNCPKPDLFWNVFMTGTGRQKLKKHDPKDSMPIVLNDQLGFSWIAVYYPPGSSWFLMGPSFTTHASEAYLRKRFDSLSLSPSLLHTLMETIQEIPVLSIYRTVDYAVMLHSCVSSERIHAADVILESDCDHGIETAKQAASEHHENWEYEQVMVEHIKNGIPMEMSRPFTGNPGPMAVNDPLRQAKNEMITATVLCTRAAIAGGLSPETAYSLSDYYIQLNESCSDVNSTVMVAKEMMTSFLSRVQQLKKGRQSAVVTRVKEYVEDHITSPVNLEEMAQSLGYATYYMSSAFKKDTGTAIRDYIAERKICYARQLLLSPESSIAAVSERLHFSSASYFCSVFRKYTGMSPTEYRKHGRQ